MSDMTTGELADEMGLTFADFQRDRKAVGDFQAVAALGSFVSRELERRDKKLAKILARGGVDPDHFATET